MNKEFDILCVGLIVSDLLVRPINKGVFDVDATTVDDFKIMPGGDATNESIILSRLGANVGLVGKLGDDVMGQLILKQIEANNVDVTNVKIDPDTKTSTSIVLINENGDRNFIGCKGNNDDFSIEDIDLNILRHTKIVNIGSLFAHPKLDRGGIETIFKEAKKNNVITSADTVTDRRNIGIDGIKGILKNTDFFLPSFIEAADLTNETDPEKMADIFLDYGVKTVVIKLGAEGCLIKNTSGECFHINAYKTTPVDTTGAGDNFVAGFLTGVLNRWDLEKCGKFASAVGSLCVQGIGATSYVRSMGQVLRYMESFTDNACH